MVDKLGFVRTIEAILAAAIAFSIYNFIQTYIYSQITDVKITPKTEINDFISLINVDDYVKNNDYLGLDYLFNKMFYKNVYYYFEPTYFKKIVIENATQNISFVYHFPLGIDKNSIKMYYNGSEVPTNALFNWKRVPILFQSDVFNKYVKFNISIDNGSPDTFMFFIKNEKVPLNISYWDGENITIGIYVPHVEKNEVGYFYYSNSNNIKEEHYNFDGEFINVSTLNIEYAPSAEIMLKPKNNGTYYLEFSLFSNKKNDYANIENINNNGLIIDYDENIKGGTIPISTTLKKGCVVKKIIKINNGLVELKIYGGYI